MLSCRAVTIVVTGVSLRSPMGLNMKSITLPMALATICLAAASGLTQQPPSDGLVAPWVFAIGDWDLVETNYSAEGEVIQTNIGSAVFSYAMNGARLQEFQSLLREGETLTALHLFVYDPRNEQVEIVRTDSGHYGFWVIVGKLRENGISLAAKHPDRKSKVTRRITYKRVDDNHFSRQLEFSSDQGKSWFVRSVWVYTRR